jgi:hypothetical protein
MLTTLAVQFLVLWKNHLVVELMRFWLLKASRVSRVPSPFTPFTDKALVTRKYPKLAVQSTKRPDSAANLDITQSTNHGQSMASLC